MGDLDNLEEMVAGTQLSSRKDVWISKLSMDGKFYVRDLRSIINARLTRFEINPTVWTHLVPSKAACFVWRACQDRIPTKAALARRGMQFLNLDCHLCGSGLEDSNHVIVNCLYLKETLDWLWRWCNVPAPTLNTVSDLISFAANWGRCPKKRKVFIAIIYGYFWCVWKARNNRTFNKVRITPMMLADNILIEVFGWVKYRGNFKNCNWQDWC